MNDKVAKTIFYAGTLISLTLFLALTIDTHRQIRVLSHADQLSPQVIAGKHVWQDHNCNDCHTILGFGAYYAPDLTKVYWRRGADGIVAAVTRPERHTSWRKMPHVRLTDTQVTDLVAFLKWTSEIDTHNWPPQDQKYRNAAMKAATLEVTPGAALFEASGCFECHRISGTGGDQGPDLTRVGSRLDEPTLEKLLLDPTSANPKAEMPAPDLTPEARKQLATFLAGLR